MLVQTSVEFLIILIILIHIDLSYFFELKLIWRRFLLSNINKHYYIGKFRKFSQQQDNKNVSVFYTVILWILSYPNQDERR